MADNYRVTAKRTGASSAVLHNSKEFFNACYLGGYVIECCQKLLLESVTNAGTWNYHELDDLHRDYKAKVYALKKSRHPKASQLIKAHAIVDIDKLFKTIFETWHPKYRYDDAHGWDETTSQKYQQEIIGALKIIARLQINGFIK
jgi:hypothetical protein